MHGTDDQSDQIVIVRHLQALLCSQQKGPLRYLRF